MSNAELIARLRNRVKEMKAQAMNLVFDAKTAETKAETLNSEALRLEAILDGYDGNVKP